MSSNLVGISIVTKMCNQHELTVISKEWWLAHSHECDKMSWQIEYKNATLTVQIRNNHKIVISTMGM